MKIQILLLLMTGIVAAAPVSILAMSGGDYEINWSTIDGGGGTSAGGQYIVTGTIGQPEAGYSEGGSYEILGGFTPGWPLCIVDLSHYVKFAEYWLGTGSGLPADLYEDNIVDFFDLKLFVDEWLCYCPYNWPLR
ncbi:MAG: hypothetical protein WC476_11445 [Phycisphaerae bacterium]|jgi:hypothetical protein